MRSDAQQRTAPPRPPIAAALQRLNRRDTSRTTENAWSNKSEFKPRAGKNEGSDAVVQYKGWLKKLPQQTKKTSQRPREVFMNTSIRQTTNLYANRCCYNSDIIQSNYFNFPHILFQLRANNQQQRVISVRMGTFSEPPVCAL